MAVFFMTMTFGGIIKYFFDTYWNYKHFIQVILRLSLLEKLMDFLNKLKNNKRFYFMDFFK